MFIRRKTYNALVAEIDTWKELAEKMVDVAESFQRNASKWQDIAISCQEDNKRLVVHEEEMLAKMKELEAKLDLAIKQRDYYYDLLESTSDAYEEDGIMGREAE